MSNKHTPGPWKVEYDNGDNSDEGQWYNAGPAKIEFWYNSTQKEHDEAEANARLIAAAPEMLELLMDLNVEGGHGLRNHERMRAIFAKIEQP